MQIHEGNGLASVCGSNQGVKIKLQYKSNMECTTELSDKFSKDDSISWTGEKLGSCETIKIDVKEPKIALWMMQDKDDKFCPISVRVNLKDTYFLLSLPEGEKHNNNKELTAFNMDGKLLSQIT